MKLRTLKDLDVERKTVLLRVDFNVPVKEGKVKDDSRIRAAIPTIEYLAQHKARIVVISHLGRPSSWEKDLTLEPVAGRLADLLKRKFLKIESGKLPDYDVPHVYFFPDDLEKTDLSGSLRQMRAGDIALLENLRFYPGEKGADPEFVKKLAALADVYVNEAFSNSHRDDASMTGVPRLLPSAVGLNLLADIAALDRVLHAPKHPFVVMMGGVKLADKAPALLNLAPLADQILLGGGLANLFFRINGFEIGKSVADEKNEEPVARQLWRDYKEKILLPRDVVVSNSLEGSAEVVKPEKVKPHHFILDIGPQTILQYSKALKAANTVLWGGALGYFENKSFSHGTFALARVFASRTKREAFGVAGGGETLEVIAKLGLGNYIDHLSTGGGAMFDFLAGKQLPGLEVLAE